MESTRVKITSITLGVALLLAAPLWIWFVAPELLKLPRDFSFTADIVSVDNLYDEDRKMYSGGVYSKTDYSYSTVKEEDGIATIKNTFAVRTPDDEPIFAVERFYGIDRTTGAHVAGHGDKDRDGYLFAPKHLDSGSTFTYWHINYDGPAHMVYSGEENLYGLRTLRFETRYEGVPIDQTVNLHFLPGVGKTRGIELEPYLQIWVEPMTGRLIKYKDESIAYYYDLATRVRLHPWNSFSNTFHERSVEANVRVAHWEKTKAQAVEWYLPTLLALAGIFFLLRGFGVWPFFRRIISLRAPSLVGGALIVAVGAVSLAGWILQVHSLTRFIPHASAMNPVTALCFMLLGLALIVRNFKPTLAMVFALATALVGGLRLLDVFGIGVFPIDLLLFRDLVLGNDVPARMAQFTALSFLLLGLIPFISSQKRLASLRLAELFSSFVFTFSLLAVGGFLFDSLNLLNIPAFFSAAVHTVFLFLILSVCMYSIYRARDEYSLALRSWLSVSGIFFATMFVTVVLAGTVDSLFMNEARTSFTREVDRATRAIEERIAISVSALEGARGLLSASQSVERDEWGAYVDALELKENYQGIQGIGYSIFISPENRESHIALVRAEGFPEYTIKPGGERTIYSAIIYIEPLDFRNREAIGYDMFSEKVRRAAMEQARDTGKSTMSGRVTLVGEIDQDIQPGFLVYVPHYKNAAPHKTLEERRKNIVGYTFSPFRARDFLEAVIGKAGIQDISIRIEDGTEGGSENILYDDGTKTLALGDTPRFSDTRIIYISSRPWTLTFMSTPTYGHSTFSRLIVPIVVLIGIIVGILIVFLFYTLISSRQRAIGYADRVTADLREAKAKDEAMLASIGDGFFATDSDGKIILTNKAFETLLGWGSSEVGGKKFSDIVPMLDASGKEVPESERLLTKTLRQKTTTTTTTTTLFQYKRKDGSTFPVAVTVSPIILEGNVAGAVEVFRDITREKEIDRAKTEFVSLASHELRTPLSTVNWYAEMLLAGDAGKISEEQKKYLDEIYHGNQRMVELVNTLLNVSRIELGTFAVEPELTDIVKLMRSVFEEQKQKIDAKKLKLKAEFAPDMPLMQVDPKLLWMVFQNLLSNAVKYTPEGGAISISMNVKKTGEEYGNEEITKDSLCVTVADTGWGIPEDQQSRIFTKLFRADNVREQDTEGTGLGLYIVKSIIEHSGGNIWFESEVNKGTTFYIVLPLEGMKKKVGSRPLEYTHI